MRVGGWRPFWAALGAALLLLLPLVGGTVLLSRRQLRGSRVQAAESQSGVAVSLPKESDRLTLLLCTSGEQPHFALLYLNASQNCINILTVPSELAVAFGDSEASLSECYRAAGPARCREALEGEFPLPEDTRYLALSPAMLTDIGGQFGTVRVSLLGALSSDQLAAAGLPGAVQEVTIGEAQEMAFSLPSNCRAAALSAVWDAFFRQKLELLPAALPDELRQNSSLMLTDLTAQDYYGLEQTLEFLANDSAAVNGEAMPVDWAAGGDACYAGEASRAAVQALFNVSPTSGQAESASAP